MKQKNTRKARKLKKNIGNKEGITQEENDFKHKVTK